jgi:hypothetical protein
MSNPAPQRAPTPQTTPSPSRGGFGQPGRPRRRAAAPKGAPLSAEQRLQIEASNRAMIDEALAQGRLTKLPARWARDAWETSNLATQDF